MAISQETLLAQPPSFERVAIEAAANLLLDRGNVNLYRSLLLATRFAHIPPHNRQRKPGLQVATMYRSLVTAREQLLELGADPNQLPNVGTVDVSEHSVAILRIERQISHSFSATCGIRADQFDGLMAPVAYLCDERELLGTQEERLRHLADVIVRGEVEELPAIICDKNGDPVTQNDE